MVGIPVGSLVGALVGSLVGSDVGSMVGSTVGSLVGVKVGTVGANEGYMVGSNVGKVEGEVVLLMNSGALLSDREFADDKGLKTKKQITATVAMHNKVMPMYLEWDFHLLHSIGMDGLFASGSRLVPHEGQK